MAKRRPKTDDDLCHAYAQIVDGDRLLERDRRADRDVILEGQVEEASYLGERGLFARLFGVLEGQPMRAALSLHPPFDAAGNDAFGLFAATGDTPALEPRDVVIGSVRRAMGRVVPVGPALPADGVVLRAFWLEDAPALHAVEAVDFALVPEAGPPAVLSFDSAPLVIGKPSRATMSGFLSRVGHGMRALLRVMDVRRKRQDEGRIVEIRSGQTIEALCVVRAEVRDATAFMIEGVPRSLPVEALPSREGPYRGTSSVYAVLAGDMPGTRAVLRVVAPKLPTSPS